MSVMRAKGTVWGTGRLTKDPETKYVGEKKTKKVKVNIGVNKKGDPPDYVNGVCWYDRADYAESLKKGDTIFIYGEDQEPYTYKDRQYKDTDIQIIIKQPRTEHGDAYEPSQKPNPTDDAAESGEKMPWDD